MLDELGVRRAFAGVLQESNEALLWGRLPTYGKRREEDALLVEFLEMWRCEFDDFAAEVRTLLEAKQQRGEANT
jgi:hypothetical protein